MGIDPFWIHAYWEVTPHDNEATMARLGSERASADWALRFYEVTYIDFDGANAHSYFDQPVDLAANNWYVNLWSSEKTYCADIGARAPSGRFAAACRSNFVHTPRADESPHYRPEWLRVEGVFDKVERVTLPPPSESPSTAADSSRLAQTAPSTSDESTLQMVSESVDRREPHPSRRSQKMGPPQGDRILSFENNNGTARPEEPPSSGGVSKGARWIESTVSPQDMSTEARLGAAWHEVRGSSWRPLGSSGSGSWAPSGRAAVDLKSDAETSVSSHVQPNQFGGPPLIPARK